jgi:endonuclease/exonuclease/phosphatase family metal-dependent hydrolase
MAIFYDTRQLTLVENCDFWLSDTPGVVASQSWDSSLPRSTTYGRFRRNNATTSSSSNTNNDDEFYFFNTHLDHMGPEARIKGSRVIVEKLEEVMKKAKQNKSPPPLIFLVGDFNSTRSEIPWNFLTGKQSYEGLKVGVDCLDYG